MLKPTTILALVGFAIFVPSLLTPPIALGLQAEMGRFGSSPGSFIKPVGLAVDEDGNVFVVDVVNATLQKFEAENQLVSWQFKDATLMFVAVDSEDHIYITDASCDCVHKSYRGRNFSSQWGSEGKGNGQFRDPAGLAADDGYVFVVDSKNHRIQKFSSDGEFIAKWGSFGKENGNFAFPAGIALDEEGNLYVADTGNHRVQKFTGNGYFLAAWGNKGTREGEFDRPTDVTLNQEGHIYVVDSGNHRVQVFDGDGDYISEWGQKGSGRREFRTPLCIAVNEEDLSVYVSDSGNSRVQRVPGGGDASDPSNTTWGDLKDTFRKGP